MPSTVRAKAPQGAQEGSGLSRMLGVSGLHPTKPWEKCQLSLGTRGKGGRKGVASLARSLGAPWLLLTDDTTYFTLQSHWVFPQPCSDIHAVLPGTPVGRWHSRVVALPPPQHWPRGTMEAQPSCQWH